MPGIAGIIAATPSVDHAPILKRMLKTMLHEPFYTSGSYVNEQLGVAVGWVSRQGSYDDCMPLRKRNEVCLVFSGEHFEDRRAGNGSNANASSLITKLQENRATFLNSLNGWFSGVLIDLRKREATLFNDRYGMHRIYLHAAADGLYFASEAKALLAVLPEARRIDLRSLAETFSFGCVLENRTLFAGLSLLPPGSCWTAGRAGVIRKETYFTPATWESRAPLGKEQFYQELKRTFCSLLPRYFDASQPMALSLTGGLDTRMILSCIRLAGGSLPCYTFGGMYRDCFDVKVARSVAEVCGQTHRVLPMDRSFFTRFPELAEKTVYVTDGGLDVSGSADLFVNMQARQIAPIRLTGNYGSEVLRGSRHLKALPATPGLFEPAFEQQVNDAAATLAANVKGHPVSFAVFKQAPWHHYNRLALEQSQLTPRSPYLDNDLVGLMFRAPREALMSSDLSFRLIREGNPQLAAIMTDRGLGGNRGRAASRMSYLYHEFLFKADYAFNYGMPQWLARINHSLLAPFRIERLFLGTHKFYHFRVWFRDELAGFVKEVLLDRRSLQRPYLNARFVEAMVRDHTAGRRNYTTEITKLMTAELLQRLLTDAGPHREA